MTRPAAPPRHSLLIVAAAAVALAAGGVAGPSLPPPQSVVGWEPCADEKLATFEQTAEYLRQLAAAAPGRLRLEDIGPTAEGRRELMAIISSERNLGRLERYRTIARTLALGRHGATAIDPAEAHALAREGRAVVWIDFGLHASEVAGAQTAPLLAFKLVSEESDEMRAIRDNVVVLLVPNMNPDGTTAVANWYMQHQGKPWESRLPELWHKYAGHDNNRDWFMMTQPETRNAARQLYAEWFPQIVYDQHQSAPFPARIFVPPFDDPVNPNIPPLVIRGVNLAGEAIARRLDREGKRGAISRIGYDTWWNGGMRTAPYFHNMIGLLTETSHASATPAIYDRTTFPRVFPNGAPTLEPSTDYPSPFLGGEWHLRTSCDYMVAASLAVLDLAAERREEWLYDIYRLGRDTVAAHASETFLVPAEQWDGGTAVKLVNLLRLGAIDVERATGPFRVGPKQYGAGTFVIRGRQPFASYANDLLTPQAYPDLRLFPGGPPKRPYDMTGWTLPFQMGVTVDRVTGPVEAATEPVDVAAVSRVAPPPPVAAAFALDTRANDAFTAVNRLLKAGETVDRAVGPVVVAGTDWPAGTFLVRAQPGTAGRVAREARALGVPTAAVDRLPDRVVRVQPPRIGVYHAWGGNIDEGWTRWVLEQFEFPYTSLHDADIRSGGLRSRFDAIVLPDASYDQMLRGLAAGSMPPQFTGGMTAQGVANLEEFVTGGWTLVALEHAAELPIIVFGLPLRNVTASSREGSFYAPGSILRLTVDPTQPVAWGMPTDSAAFFSNDPAFAVDPVRAGGLRVAAKYPPRDVLLSGWALGTQTLAGRAAAVQADVGAGRVVFLGFAAHHRGQSHGTFKLLFNALLLGG